MVNFPNIWKNHTKYPEFSEYSADKMLELWIFEKNLNYLGLHIK